MQACNDTSEAVELFEPQGLYLKPIARLSISVQLPQMKIPGKSISNWEVMEKLKAMIKPKQFTVLKVTKSTLDFIRFEGEAESRACLKAISARLESKTIKLGGFPDQLKVRSAEAKLAFPARHDWDAYFRDAVNMNEMKPGERPDTIHLSNLPCRWFANRKDASADQNKPSEFILKKVFENLGRVRVVDIPMLDPYLRELTRKSGAIQTFSFGGLTFEAFVQYDEYIGFVKAMASLKGMKLMYKGEDQKSFTCDIKVDFDKTKHLSEENITKRRIERDKLKTLEQLREEERLRQREEEERKKELERKRKEEEEREKEEKKLQKRKRHQERLKAREAKRRLKLQEMRRKKEQERLARIKAQKDRRKLMDQRKVEATRMITVLLERVEEIRKKEEVDKKMKELEDERLRQLKADENKKEEQEKALEEARRQQQQKMQDDEKMLREKILKNFKMKQELKQEKLRQELAGKSKLKSVLIPKVTEKVKKPPKPKISSAIHCPSPPPPPPYVPGPYDYHQPYGQPPYPYPYPYPPPYWYWPYYQ